MDRRISFPLIAVICMALSACIGWLVPTPKASVTYKGKLVDAVTGLPVEGAVIVATWHNFTPNYFVPIFHQGGGSDSCYELVNVESTTSGPDGTFELPGWAGKLGHCQSMSVDQPYIVYYKPGYEAFTNTFGDEGNMPGADITVTGSDQGVIRMSPVGPHRRDLFKGTDNYLEDLTAYAVDIKHAFEQDEQGPCFWKEESPALLMVLQEERRLSAYAPGLDFLHLRSKDRSSPPVPGLQCIDPAAVTALEQQAGMTE